MDQTPLHVYIEYPEDDESDDEDAEKYRPVVVSLRALTMPPDSPVSIVTPPHPFRRRLDHHLIDCLTGLKSSIVELRIDLELWDRAHAAIRNCQVLRTIHLEVHNVDYALRLFRPKRNSGGGADLTALQLVRVYADLSAFPQELRDKFSRDFVRLLAAGRASIACQFLPL